MTKDSLYFPHDYNSRGDDKIVPMLMAHGIEGFGAYWWIVEKIYEGQGSLTEDYTALSWDMRIPADKIKSIVTGFGLFYLKDGKIRSRSADRRLAEKKRRREVARANGLASGISRRNKSERLLNNRSATAELEIEEIEERKKERKEVLPDSLCASTDHLKRPDCLRPRAERSKYCEDHKLKAAEHVHDQAHKRPSGITTLAQVIQEGLKR